MSAFARGSVSFRLYPHQLSPAAMIDEMQAQAVLAEASGFDGVMISERHGGIAGNVPNPIQVAGWVAGAMERAWVAPAPVLALFRNPALIVEEIAWLAARYPDRVGVGLGTGGGHELDFDMYDVSRDELAARYEPVLAFVTEHLQGRADDDLSHDHAVARCRDSPVPVISAALSRTAARRAARCGCGTMGNSLVALERDRELVSEYQLAGGRGPEVLLRFVWLGELPAAEIEQKFAEYRRSAARTGRAFSGVGEIMVSRDPDELAERLAAALRVTGRSCLHLRVHVPGVSPLRIREQIQALGDAVLPKLRSEIFGS
jgi:alkanesulfonate monooxygenase SsuD/methylene tetrahydromethanopterin reductase-like flavin-dependent oxidoreductase (luciferase family)